MRRILPAIFLLGLLVSAPSMAQAKIILFACEAEWAALARGLGRDDMEIITAVGPRQDPHHIRAKPSLLAAIRRADLVICTGAGLEIGWLPVLLQKAAGRNTQPGGVGYLLAAEYVPMLEKPERIDRSQGDIHPEGNPHVHLNPHNITMVAKELTARLQAVDPSHAGEYEANLAVFLQQWREAITRWEADSARLKGMGVVVHHKSFSYLLDWLDMTEAGSLEVKPGIPPTTAHLEELLMTLKSSPSRLIIRTPYDPAGASEWLSQKTGTPAVILPFTVGGDEQSSDLFRLFDRTLAILMGAQGA